MIRLFNAYFPRRTLLLALTESTLIFFVLLPRRSSVSGTDTQLALATQHGYWKIGLVGVICLFCICTTICTILSFSQTRARFPSRLIQGRALAGLIMAVVYYAFPSGDLPRLCDPGITLVGPRLLATAKSS